MGPTSMAAGRVTRFLARHYPLEHHRDNADVEFDFLDDIGEALLAQSASSDECGHPNEMEEQFDQDEDHRDTVEENRTFWDKQHQLLQASICRTSSSESRIRHATKEALQEIQSAETVCGCGRQVAVITTCRNCLMREVSRRLQKAGYDSAICKTKWRSSPDIPSGEHNFLDVIDSTKKGEVRVIVELNFRGEFEMARGSEDYNRLVRRLPEVFVGKVERLSNLIKILCMGAKRCMKEKKMHMGPWRKHRYMQAKWLGPCERNTSTTSLSVRYNSERILPRPKASMLTVDLLEKPSQYALHCC
ncbi:hypothetical protein JHK82_037137 [Glycine max]|uniref:Uncharacterized protein n=1 Tax=Glycine max TaxID=3847 RepID=A0A0R4J4Y9_SOYBN|nr:uncharacterized protein LOC100803860 [Glycine max]KAG4977863.1 hypothetical protein JHK86_037337 [Glycine max]KAG5113868.1 hypothetical protein JHK82_037137 [Glycine max]KAG5131146.1 hypothetical protein JHK84_037543 [Glycine max]KAH1103076.1 hypothetical protein GYH30_037194 [Glycine max]KAH1217991.1 hypothetical protein GmHk_13G038514 [Glycine max]|eukprot:NP_001241955.2 uncharacterized protein LOC100803860 [Glycine max]